MNRALIRLFDIVLSLAVLFVLLAAFIPIAVAIAPDSDGGILFRQRRVGRHNRDFTLYKFRTMRVQRSGGLLTVGGDDPRITATGMKLRKWKLDELPQLWNVLSGTM